MSTTDTAPILIETLDTQAPPTAPTTTATEPILKSVRSATKKANPEREHLPRKGPCGFLIIDATEISKDPQSFVTLDQHIGTLRQSNDFHLFPGEGQMTVTCSSERDPISLTEIASSIKAAIPGTKMLVGKATIDYPEDPRAPEIIGKPDTEDLTEWKTSGTGISFTIELASLIKDPSQREGSLLDITTSPTSSPKFVNLDSFEPKVKLRNSRTDKLIGCDDKLADFHNALTDDEKKLIIVRGPAGIGKSTITEYALAGIGDSYNVITSLHKGQGGLPGAGLITFAQQLWPQVKKADTMIDNELEELKRFINLSFPEQLTFAQTNAKELAKLCSGALEVLTWYKGEKTFLILEDLHHGDSFSLPYLFSIAQTHIHNTDGKGKVITSLRPEEMFRSKAQKEMIKGVESFYGDASVSTIDLDGIDLSNPAISSEFVFHALPQDFRGGKTEAKGHKVDTWHQKLGAAAGRLPFAMKSYMDSLEDDPKNLTVEGGVIKANEYVVAQISQTSDLATFYHQRIEKLEPKAQKLLVAIALMGGRIPELKVGDIMKNVLEIEDTEEFARITENLQLGRYIEAHEDGSGWNLAHPNIGDFVISSVKDPGDIIDTSITLYKLFKDDEGVHPDSKFALLHNVADSSSSPEITDRFWDEYAETAKTSLEDAKFHNDLQRGYNLGNSILQEKGTNVMATTIALLANGEAEELPESIKELAITALLTIAQNATFLGKSEESTEAVEKLAAISSKNPGTIDETELTLIRFQNAYITKNMAELESTASSLESEPLDPSAKAVMEIKVAFRKKDYAAVKELFAQNAEALSEANMRHAESHKGMPSPDYLEALRLATTRAPYENLRDTVIGKFGSHELDGDYEIHPGGLTSEQKQEIETINNSLKDFRNATDEYPTALDPIASTSLLELEGQVRAHLGNYPEARDAFAECWRQSTELSFHSQAARAAKLLLNVYVQESMDTKNPHLLLKALEVYNNQAKISLAHLEDKDESRFMLENEIIPTVGRLITHYNLEDLEGDVPKDVAELLTPLIPKIFEAFESLINKHSEKAKNGWSGFMAYYLTSWLEPVITASEKLGIEIPPIIQSSPFLDPKNLAKGFVTAAASVDAGINNAAATKRENLLTLFARQMDRRDQEAAVKLA